MFIAGCDEGNVYVIQRSQHLSNADLEALAESADSDEKKAKLGPMKLKNVIFIENRRTNMGNSSNPIKSVI